MWLLSFNAFHWVFMIFVWKCTVINIFKSSKVLIGRYTRMCSLRLTNVQHSKNCFARKRTEKTTTITKKRDFHHMKRRTLSVQLCFYFFDIIYMKKVFQVCKTQTIMVFGTYNVYQKNKNNVAQPKFSFLCGENLVS